MDDPRPDDLIRRRRRRSAAGDQETATVARTIEATRHKPEVTSDLGADVPVTEAEINLIANRLGDEIERILQSE